MNKHALHLCIRVTTLLMVLALILPACAPAATKPPAATTAPTVAPTKPPAPTATTAKPIKIVVGSIFPEASILGWKGSIAKFKEKYPNVEFELQVTPFAQFVPKVLSQIAGGDPPDMITIENRYFAQFAAEGVLEDLTPYMQKYPGFSTKDFFKAWIDRFSMDGKAYAFPWDASSGVLFYVPKAFDEAGVKYPTDDWTWKDLQEAAQKLTKIKADGTVERYGYDMVGGYYSHWVYFVYSNGGKIVDNPLKPTKCLLDQPEAIQGLQFYVDMIKNKIALNPETSMSMGYAASQDLFLTGKVAISQSNFVVAKSFAEKYKAAGIKAALVPKGPNGERWTDVGGTAVAIMKASKNKELAFEFLTTLFGPVGTQEAYKAAQLGAIETPAHIASFDWYMNQPITFLSPLEPFKKAMDYARFVPLSPAWGEIDAKCITPEIPQILSGKKPLEATMKSITLCVNDKLAQVK